MREDGVIDKLIEKHIKIVSNMEFDKQKKIIKPRQGEMI